MICVISGNIFEEKEVEACPLPSFLSFLLAGYECDAWRDYLGLWSGNKNHKWQKNNNVERDRFPETLVYQLCLPTLGLTCETEKIVSSSWLTASFISVGHTQM